MAIGTETVPTDKDSKSIGWADLGNFFLDVGRAKLIDQESNHAQSTGDRTDIAQSQSAQSTGLVMGVPKWALFGGVGLIGLLVVAKVVMK